MEGDGQSFLEHRPKIKQTPETEATKCKPSDATPTLIFLLFLRPSVAHVACKSAYGQKKNLKRGMGGLDFTPLPSLTPSCPLSRCLSQNDFF